MTLTEYNILSPSGLSASVQYGLNGLLIAFNLVGDITDVAHETFLQELPMADGDMEVLAKKYRSLTIKPVPIDLSFERFWTDYDYKVGSKSKCEKIWEKLTKGDKIKALAAIHKFKAWSLQKGYDMPYPERYLTHKRFNNQLK